MRSELLERNPHRRSRRDGSETQRDRRDSDQSSAGLVPLVSGLKLSLRFLLVARLSSLIPAHRLEVPRDTIGSDVSMRKGCRHTGAESNQRDREEWLGSLEKGHRD